MSLCYWYLISPCSWTYFEGCELQEYRLQRYYTAADIAGHNTAHNCWVSFFGRVYASWRKIPSWIHVVDSKVWKKNMDKKKFFLKHGMCSEECGNISKNKRIDHANLRDFCVWPRDATLSGISFPITLQIAPVIVPLIMFSFDPRSPCPSPSHPSDIEVVSPRTWHLSWRSTKVHWHSPSSPPRAPTSPSGSMRRLGLEKLCLNKRKIWKIWKQARFL